MIIVKCLSDKFDYKDFGLKLLEWGEPMPEVGKIYHVMMDVFAKDYQGYVLKEFDFSQDYNIHMAFSIKNFEVIKGMEYVPNAVIKDGWAKGTLCMEWPIAVDIESFMK